MRRHPIVVAWRTVHPACIHDYRRARPKALTGFLFGYLDGGSFASSRCATTKRLGPATACANSSCATSRSSSRRLILLARRGAADRARPGGTRGPDAQARRDAGRARGGSVRRSVLHVDRRPVPVEEVRAATQQPFWFQLYLLRDRGIVKELLARAKAVQCSALLLRSTSLGSVCATATFATA